MASVKKTILGSLLVLLTVLTGVVVLQMDEFGVKLKVAHGDSTFYVKDGNSWVVSGIEYNDLYKGSSKIPFNKSATNIETILDPGTNSTTVIRTSYYNKTLIKDTYVLNGNIGDVELFPISHTIEVFNGTGLTYQYRLGSFQFNGPTNKNASSPIFLWKNMKVEWSSGYSKAVLTQNPLKSDSLTVQWPITSDYLKVSARLFDPTTFGGTLLRNYTFETGLDGWSGNGTTGTVSGDTYIGLISADSRLQSPTLWNTYTGNVTINITFEHYLANYTKLRFRSGSGSDVGPDIMFEHDGTSDVYSYRFKHEGDTYCTAATTNTSVKLVASIFVDVTNNRSSFALYNYTTGQQVGSTCTAEDWGDAVNAGNYFTVEKGTMDGSGFFRLYNFSIYGDAGAPDTTPPTISSVSSGTPASTSATITWTTDENANASVNYGLTSALGTRTDVVTLQTSQSVGLSGLTQTTLYYYNVTSCDASANCNTTGPYNFTTATSSPGTYACVYNNTFTVDAGNWTGGTYNGTMFWYEGHNGDLLYLNGNGFNPNLGDSTYTNISFRLYLGTTQVRVKMYYDADNDTISGNALLFEWDGSLAYNVKPEPLYTPQIAGLTANTWHTVNFIINTSATNKFRYIIDGVVKDVNHTLAGGDYFNIDIGTGGAGVYFTNMTICTTTGSDTTAPVISSVAASGIKDDRATITWTTDEGSTTSVKYGTTSAMTSTATGSGPTTSHTVSLTSLDYGTIYYYNVTSCDAASNCATSGPNTFTTYGRLSISHITPASNSNVTINTTFSYNDSITCLGGPESQTCGNVSIYLDPMLNGSDTGYGGYTYIQNYNMILLNIVNQTRWNTTQSFSSGDCVVGDTCLWVPWMDSSSACNAAGSSPTGNLKTYSSFSTVNRTKNVMVTDELSEVGLVLSGGNASVEPFFEQFYNVRQSIVGSGLCAGSIGNLTTWVLGRDDNQFTCLDCDGAVCKSASDTNWRDVIAFWQAGYNPEFSADNRTKYKALAEDIMADSLEEEFVYSCQATQYWGTVCYWPFGGTGAEGGGLNSGTQTDMYVGYYQDLLRALLLTYKATGNETYLTAFNDSVKSLFVLANYTGGTSASDFRPGYMRIKWCISGATVYSCEPTSDGSYYWTAGNPSWDTADAPRLLEVCNVLSLYNQTFNGTISGIGTNLSNYCEAWSKTPGFTGTASPLQYYPNGTVFTGPYGGYFTNGMMAPSHTYFNMSLFDTKLDEIFSTYSWANLRFGSESCGNGGTYNSVRATKALMYGLGIDQTVGNVINGSSSSPTKNGLVSMTPGDTPFYTTTNNPFNNGCLDTLDSGETCYINWTVNATGQYATYVFFSYANSTVSSLQYSSNVNITITSGSNVSDTTPPVIGNITETITQTYTTIDWSTDENANTTIEYGLTPAYGNTQSDSNFVGTHSYTFTPLNDEITYYYHIINCDSSGNCVDSGPEFFTTTGYTPSITFCAGVSKVVFLGDVTAFNWTTFTITDYDIAALNQTTCLFNITKAGTAVKSYTGVTNVTTTANQRVYCGAAYASKVELNTTPATVRTGIINGTVSCWSDWINLDPATYKEINITISVV